MSRKTWWLFGLAGVLCMGVFAWTLSALSDFPLQRSRIDPGGAGSRLAAEAEFIRTYVFEDGSAGASFVASVLPDWVGLTPGEFSDAHPHWRVISFTSDRVVVEEPCGPMRGRGFVRTEHGRVVIYEGDMNGCYRQQSEVDADLNKIPPFQREELDAGIPYESDADLSRILDGIRAP